MGTTTPEGISGCDQEGLSVINLQMQAVQRQKQEFALAMRSGCGFVQKGAVQDFDPTIAMYRKIREACRSAMANNREKSIGLGRK